MPTSIFVDLKAYLSSPPLLSPSKPGEELFLYLAVSPAVVSAAVVREKNGVQKPVYFISRALKGAKEKYPPIEKLAFALVTATQKLKPYFRAHTVVVLTDKPLRRVMSSLEATGQMALWVVKLSEFNVQYRPRTTIKGQVITDFIVEFTLVEGQGAESTQTDLPTSKQVELMWYPTARKGIKLNAWSVLISLQPIMRQGTEL